MVENTGWFTTVINDPVMGIVPLTYRVKVVIVRFEKKDGGFDSHSTEI